MCFYLWGLRGDMASASGGAIDRIGQIVDNAGHAPEGGPPGGQDANQLARREGSTRMPFRSGQPASIREDCDDLGHRRQRNDRK